MKFLLVENYSQSETGRGIIVFTGKDTGIGIRTEQIPHLFQRFHRGITNRSYEGSGLGLAQKELVELQGANFSGVGLRRRKHVYSLVANWHSSPPLDQVLEVRTELISAAVELADLELVGETSVQERASHTKDASCRLKPKLRNR